MVLCVSNVSFAQNNSSGDLSQIRAERNPLPKQTHVEYAPNAPKPTLAEQIATTEKMLEQLHKTPEEKRPVFIKEKIARLEKELKAKKEEKKYLFGQ